MIKVDIIESGSTITACKMLGVVPETHEPDDFNLYVRTIGSTVRVTRSDTDETIVSGVGFTKAMQALADYYGLSVTVALDYGVKSTKKTDSLVGTWKPTKVQTWTTLATGERIEIGDRVTVKDLDDAPTFEIVAFITSGTIVRDVKTGLRHVSRDVRYVVPGYLAIKLAPVAPVAPEVPDASDVAEATAQAWTEAGSPRCVHCERPYLCATDEHVTPFPHECVTAEDLARFMPDPERVTLTIDASALDIPTNAEVDALMAEHDAAMSAWAASLVEALTVRTPGTLYTLAMAEAEIAESLGDAWHGTGTCVNCGCDPDVPVYTLNRGFRFPMGKRARKQVKRNKRTRVGA